MNGAGGASSMVPAAASRHISVVIAASPEVVYAYAADPTHLPDWASGLASARVQEVDGAWWADSPMGRVKISFTQRNDFGVLDHVVTLPSGERVFNAMRVIPDGDDSEMIFTVRRRGLSEVDFERDCSTVLADLQVLRSRCTGR